MNTDSAKSAPTVGSICETRIALSFFGGVALAVYESGVALEFFRLVKGEGVYAQLKDLIGDVVVDIITGTSAGGLNGAFLGNALVNRGDMRKLLDLWRTEGDIDKLLYGVWKAGPKSLLDGDRFRAVIFEALLAKRTAPLDETLQDALELFLTSTNVDGDRVLIRTPDNEEIPTRTHRQVFHFRYRKKQPGTDTPEINDFNNEEDMCLLAQAARASSSFPLAFEPVLVKKDGLGERARNLEADAYHIDGGVLDNKPIDLALRAIAKRRANKKVHRLLFYIDPDPEQVGSRVCQIDPKPYTGPEVVMKALLGLPGYQSITTALQDIEQRNVDVRDLQRTLSYYETQVARFRAWKGFEEDKKQPPAAATEAEPKQDEIEAAQSKFKYIPPENPPTALFRAQEDAYLDLRLQREFPKQFFGVITEFFRTLTDMEEAAGRAHPKAKPNHQIAEKVYQIKCLLVGSLDLRYHRRFCKYLVHVIRTLYPERPSGTGDGTGLREIYIDGVTERLNRLKDFLYEQDELLVRRQEAEAHAFTAELVEIEARVREVSEHLPGKGKANTGSPLALLDELFGNLYSTPFIRRRSDFLARLCETVRLKLKNATDELTEKLKEASTADSENPYLAKVTDGYLVLRDALISFYLRDMIIYPLMSGEDLDAETQQINFSRISPADANLYMPGLSAQEKLAGETLAHFGGFLNEDWRGNDLTWGRLDTAEILIRKLHPGTEEQKRAMVAEAQREIALEMRSLGMGITNKPPSTPPEVAGGPPPRKDLLGMEGMKALPCETKIAWGWRAAVTLLKILRQSLAESKAAFFLRVPLAILDKLIVVLSFLFLLVTQVIVKLFRWRVLLYLLIAALLIGLGALLAFLWDHSLQDFWDRVTALFH